MQGSTGAEQRLVIICKSECESDFKEFFTKNTNATVLFSKNHGQGTLYALVGTDHKKIDQVITKLEQTFYQPIFKKISTQYSGKVKSLANNQEKLKDKHYKALFDTSKPVNGGHYPHPDVRQLFIRPGVNTATTTMQAQATTMSPEPAAATTTQAQDTTMSPEPEAATTMQAQDTTMSPAPEASTTMQAQTTIAPLQPDEDMIIRECTDWVDVCDLPPSSPTETALCVTMESLGVTKPYQRKIKVLEDENAILEDKYRRLKCDFECLQTDLVNLKKARATVKLIPNDAYKVSEKTLVSIQENIFEAATVAEETNAQNIQLQVEIDQVNEDLRDAQTELKQYRDFEKQMSTKYVMTRQNAYTGMVTKEVLNGPAYLNALVQRNNDADDRCRDLGIQNKKLVDDQAHRLMEINSENERQRVAFQDHATAIDEMRAVLQRINPTEMDPDLRAELQLIVDGFPPGHQEQIDKELDELLKNTEIVRKPPLNFIGPIYPFWIRELRARHRMAPYQTIGMLMLFIKKHDRGYKTRLQ